ncbi:Der GTPase-activating protein YihI [Vibrio parahaemolyticus]|uniref:Der GTPase-activating protein YihI n=1 Tax=Vibrio parahaemolyticus TaxID=670 RepID=UPI0006A604BB|nr:Der GTPase-activating protein YihI [Vibrio parahaemolyticus]EGQ8943959.1 Der GTPase-activating protein YihI [Vibrio parahaemolyticus]EGR3004542.1 Der GTPase-activating protein YihI [Vibrio parahaemolyticus]EGR3143178.1 Der GTPase-activating protein YihI [Vibrio parahaemolyticus]EGR3181567.1 Der GTPase-activating protein YihI [Vibrio parahaemolyticus]EGR3194964.1 Der GTPase-activating protein YihI [Vibrio parahaemolyticus]
MSRKKKSRKPGAAGAPEFVVTRNRTESDVEGRLRKRVKKRKGLKTGSRNSEVNEQKKQSSAQNRDPRLGSKKKIPLIVEPVKKMTKQERRLSAEQELEMLENDAQLNVLLDRIEAGENLGTGLQKYVDEKLDRIEKLMDQLGLLEPEEEEDFTVSSAKGSRNDDDLLADFDDINFEDYKG